MAYVLAATMRLQGGYASRIGVAAGREIGGARGRCRMGWGRVPRFTPIYYQQCDYATLNEKSKSLISALVT